MGKFVTFIFAMLLIPLGLVAQTNIVAVEYFIDNDPGFGNGTSVVISPSSNVSSSVSIPTASLSKGTHFLYVRSQDENGIWTITEARAFRVVSNPVPPVQVDLVALEYFIDSDPGPGNGTAIPITSGQSASVTESIDVSSLSEGFHYLYLRTLGSDGDWSVSEGRPFQVNIPVNISRRIVKIEYFFDTDPGIGNGSQIDIVPIPADCLSCGCSGAAEQPSIPRVVATPRTRSMPRRAGLRLSAMSFMIFPCNPSIPAPVHPGGPFEPHR